MAAKPRKWWSTSLNTKEMQIKTMSYQFTSIRTASIKQNKNWKWPPGARGWLGQWSVWLLISGLWARGPRWVWGLLKNKNLSFFHSFFFFSLAYSFWETVSEPGRGRKRRRESESHAGSALPAQSPMQGSNPLTTRAWPELRSGVGRLPDWATQAPLK